MLTKIQPTCHVCKHNSTLRALKTTLVEIQAELRAEWRSSRVIQLDEHILPKEVGIANIHPSCDDWFLLNTVGKPTVIPSYYIYDKTWKKAFSINPLEMDWLLFDTHDSWDMDYLVQTIEVLHDQKDLWINDLDTTDTSIMVLFNRFISALKRLLLFASNLSIST